MSASIGTIKIAGIMTTDTTMNKSAGLTRKNEAAKATPLNAMVPPKKILPTTAIDVACNQYLAIRINTTRKHVRVHQMLIGARSPNLAEEVSITEA
jgi:hypothetical protein